MKARRLAVLTAYALAALSVTGLIVRVAAGIGLSVAGWCAIAFGAAGIVVSDSLRRREKRTHA